jgi:hypothetical protein
MRRQLDNPPVRSRQQLGAVLFFGVLSAGFLVLGSVGIATVADQKSLGIALISSVIMIAFGTWIGWMCLMGIRYRRGLKREVLQLAGSASLESRSTRP